MTNLEVKQHKSNFEVIASFGKHNRGGDTIYHNIIDRDPNKIAQVLLDLEIVADFPIEEAVQIYLKKHNAKDWLGL